MKVIYNLLSKIEGLFEINYDEDIKSKLLRI